MLRNITILAFLGASIGAIAFGLSYIGYGSNATDALSTAPAGSTAVLEVDFETLRESELWADLTRSDASLEIEHITELCGFNPLEPLDRIIVFMARAEGVDQDDITLLARGNLPHLDLATCLQRAVAEDGGELEQITIEGQQALASAHGPTRAAFIGNDGLAVGMEEMVRMAIRVSNGSMASARTDERFVQLWDAIGDEHDVLAVARIPEDLRAEIVERVPAQFALGPIGEVEALGVGANLGAALEVSLSVAASSDEAASTLAESWTTAIGRVRNLPLIGRTPVGPLLEGLEFRSEADLVRADISLENEELSRLLRFGAAVMRRRARGTEEQREAVQQALEQLRNREPGTESEPAPSGADTSSTTSQPAQQSPADAPASSE